LKTKQIERHQTLREKILETIREAILKGDLKPGEKVAEPELAERFGISRTPIHVMFRNIMRLRVSLKDMQLNWRLII